MNMREMTRSATSRCGSNDSVKGGVSLAILMQKITDWLHHEASKNSKMVQPQTGFDLASMRDSSKISR